MGDGRRVERRADHHDRRAAPASRPRSAARATAGRPPRRGSATPTTSSVAARRLGARGRDHRARRRPHPPHPPRRHDRDLRRPASRSAARASRLGPRREPSYVTQRTSRARSRHGSRADRTRSERSSGRSPAAARRRRRRSRPPARDPACPIEVAAAPDGSVYIANGNARQAGRPGRHHHAPSPAATSARPLGDGGPATRRAARLRRRHRASARPASSTSATGQRSGAGNRDPARRRRRHDHDGGGRRQPDPDVLGDGGPGTRGDDRQSVRHGRRARREPVLRRAPRRRPVVRRARRRTASSPRSRAERGFGRRAAATAGRRARAELGRGRSASRWRPTARCYVAPPRGPQNFTRLRPADRPARCRSATAASASIPSAGRHAGVTRSTPRAATCARVDGLTGAHAAERSPTTGRAGSPAVTDADGNVTPIERAGGAPTAIVAPGGQRTELTVDADGWLDRLANAAGARSRPPTYHAERADGRRSPTRAAACTSFEHDAGGLLTRDEDPDGRRARRSSARAHSRAATA